MLSEYSINSFHSTMLCAIMGVLSTELVIALMPITVIKASAKDPKNQGSNEFFFF